VAVEIGDESVVVGGPFWKVEDSCCSPVDDDERVVGSAIGPGGIGFNRGVGNVTAGDGSGAVGAKDLPSPPMANVVEVIVAVVEVTKTEDDELEVRVARVALELLPDSISAGFRYWLRSGAQCHPAIPVVQ